MYEKRNKSFVSLDEYEIEPEKSSENRYPEAEDAIAAKTAFIDFSKALLDKSPKHAYALILMLKGYKGTGFAEKMQMTKMGANYVRDLVIEIASGCKGRFDRNVADGLPTRRNRNESYYRSKAEKLVMGVAEMYFD